MITLCPLDSYKKGSQSTRDILLMLGGLKVGGKKQGNNLKIPQISDNHFHQLLMEKVLG